MKKLLVLISIILLYQSYASAQIQDKQLLSAVPERKPLIFKVLATDKGKSNAIIGTADGRVTVGINAGKLVILGVNKRGIN
jgi:AICAR transformylase/IMP cyclohydrolase PurH